MKEMGRRLFYGLALVAAAVLLASCVGMDTKVEISSEGSGTVAAEYRISEELAAFGELEANKELLPIPLSREDVEKSLAGSEGLELKSWSSKKAGTDLLISTVIAFDDLDALMFYLDPSGKLATHSAGPAGQEIRFSLGDRMPSLDQEMKMLAEVAFDPYAFNFSVQLPKAPQRAESAHPAITKRQEGNTVHFEGRMRDIIVTETAPSMILSW
ncbi:MAG: hypothetical protein RBT72_00655 [Spirochaetia bacterium]|nr:hypothetical protein [Spirochaetales bacterium]MDX9783249.1 hypothetical protein [Spirochaetia bacterium]